MLSFDAYFDEMATASNKFAPSDGFYSALPFVTSVANATTAAPFTTSLILSSSQANNSYAFATASVDYPYLMPISFIFPEYTDYINMLTNYQCVTTGPPTQSPSFAPSDEPSLVPSYVPSIFPTREPTVAPYVSVTRKPTALPSSAPTMVFITRPLFS